MQPIRPIGNPAKDCSSPYFGNNATHKPSLTSQSTSPRKDVDLSSPSTSCRMTCNVVSWYTRAARPLKPVLYCSMATLGIDQVLSG